MAKKNNKFLGDILFEILKIVIAFFTFLIHFFIGLFKKNDKLIHDKSTVIDLSNNTIKRNLERDFYQSFESIELITTSVNYDVIKSRILILESLIVVIQLQKDSISQDKFESLLSIAVDKYKKDYYDRIFKDFQITLLLKNKEQRHDFYAECIYDGFIRYVKNQQLEIDNLKTEKGKANRMTKIMETRQYFITVLEETARRANNYEEIRDKLYNYCI